MFGRFLTVSFNAVIASFSLMISSREKLKYLLYKINSSISSICAGISKERLRKIKLSSSFVASV